jgi:hypothetical protein
MPHAVATLELRRLATAAAAAPPAPTTPAVPAILHKMPPERTIPGI